MKWAVFEDNRDNYDNFSMMFIPTNLNYLTVTKQQWVSAVSDHAPKRLPFVKIIRNRM